MRTCKTCNTEKEDDQFTKRRGKPTAKCLECQRAYGRAYYKTRAGYYIEKNNKRRQAKRDFVRKLKESTPCADCGVSYPHYVMDFDHLRDKDRLVSQLVASGTWKQIKEEIEKCEVVCANCHRERTFSRASHSDSI